jgi:hypothetical protein
VETESAVARIRWKVVVIIGCSEGFVLSGPAGPLCVRPTG